MPMSMQEFIELCRSSRDLSQLLAENIAAMDHRTLTMHQRAHGLYQQEIHKNLESLDILRLSDAEKEGFAEAKQLLKEILEYNQLAVKKARNTQAFINSELSGVNKGRTALSGYGQQSAFAGRGAKQGRVINQAG